VRIALARCRVLPEPDPDETLTLDAFRRSGVEAETFDWDDPSDDPAQFDAVLLRATWNYHLSPDRFLDWVSETSSKTRLMNPADMVKWNLDKLYLAELEGIGIPIVPTEFFRKSDKPDFRGLLAERRWDCAVVKPRVSASSFLTRRFSVAEWEEAQCFLETTLHERDMMVQRYLPSVEAEGERALVWIAGEVTHAVRKAPRFSGGEESISGGLIPSNEERRFVELAMSRWKDSALYARVDVMRGPEGELLLSELELIEPSLFFLQNPAALERFVAATVSRLATRDTIESQGTP
jgi:hypothetical protein